MRPNSSIKNAMMNAKRLSTIIAPLIIILMVGTLIRFQTIEPVVHAKSDSSSSNLKGTAFQDEYIPNPSFFSSKVEGITIYAGNFKLVKPPFDDLENETWLSVDVCYDLVDNGDWTIWQSSLLDAQGHQAPFAAGDLLLLRYPPITIDGKTRQHITDFRGGTSDNYKDYYEDVAHDQKTGLRCDALNYSLSPDFDISAFTITIDNIISFPREGEMCSETFRLRLQEALEQKNTGIKIETKSDTPAANKSCNPKVIQKPERLSQNDAELAVNGSETLLGAFGIRGPWVFEGSIK